MTKRLECTVDRDGAILAAKSTSIVFPEKIDLCCLLGILNSKVVSFFYSSVFGGNKLQGGYFRVGPPQLKRIPLPVIAVTAAGKRSKQERLIALVEQMLRLQKSAGTAASEQSRDVLQHQIDATDAEIDRLVYELYGLTEEEITIVEQAALKG